MVQGYYTLQEAAQVLGMKVDDLKGLAQRNQIRSFQDRGTLRFRIQDIQELQRQRLGDSDPDMVLGDAVSPKPAPVSSGPKSGIKTPRPAAGPKGEVFDFELDDSVEIGKEPLQLEGSAVRSKAGMKSSSPKSAAPKTPKQGSDSDVKLVSDGSDQFSIQLGGDLEPTLGDSDVRLGELTTNKKTSGASSRKSGIGRRSSKMGQSPADSGVRLVPMDEDAVDAAPAASESDVRLSRQSGVHRTADNVVNTEEIDLDSEIKNAEVDQNKPDTIFKMHPSKLGKPGSPFELSDNDLEGSPTKATDDEASFHAASASKAKGAKAPAKSPKPAKKNTEFDIVPGDSDEDFSLELDEESINLGADADFESEGPKSGLNLSRPTDKGISLERRKPDDHADFELDLEAPPATPKPARAKKEVTSDDDDSEFELSLDDLSEGSTAAGDDDSEFELSLDEDALAGDADSDSDFELELGDVDEEPAPKSKPKGKPKAKAKAKAADTDDQDLFETDFELPALDEDSDEETVDADSSDFELALDDSDISEEDESASQVVALDEEDDGDSSDTMDGDLDEYDDYEEGDVEEEPEVRERVVVQEVIRDRWVRPAPWGVLPVVFMLPCAVVLVLAGIMGWELVQSGSGFGNSGLVTRSVADMMGLKVK